MPKVGVKNEVGAIVHTNSNRVLSDHTVKNIYGNVNYAKTFLQGTVVNVFDGRAPGGENAIWKLTVDFEMHSGEPTLGVELKRVVVHRQHSIYIISADDSAINLCETGCLPPTLCEWCAPCCVVPFM